MTASLLSIKFQDDFSHKLRWKFSLNAKDEWLVWLLLSKSRMKILLVHNRYKQYGGEDATFEAERTLLEGYGNDVETLVFDNSEFEGVLASVRIGLKLFYNSNSAKRIRESIKRFGPDIIHVHNFFYTASPSILFEAYRHKVPIIVTLQNFRLICSGSLLMRNSSICELCVDKIFPTAGVRYKCHRGSGIQTAHLTLVTGLHKLIDTWNKKVTKYIAVTDFARQKYINSSLHLKPDKIIVKPSSVLDVAPSGFEDREGYFLYVGRLSKEKGIDTLLSAFKGSLFSLEIIGDGPMKQDVELACLECTNIRYLGYRDKSFIISKLKKSRALIFTSIWYECLPITILEAFSTGTPVIISNIGNLNQIVSHKYNGIHFEPNNPGDLLRVIMDFNENRSGYKQLYENARITYETNYSPEINYNNLIGIYEDTIEKYRIEDH